MRPENGTSVFDTKFRMDVEVYDLYPGLPEEEALIGGINVNPAVYTFAIRMYQFGIWGADKSSR